ncbi:MAG TPA: glycosyltransferase family 4 protein [Acidobacteriota bacterium]|nr:glycosyltransferase family 4 protein [Acidobacteriota bacterium]
MESHSAENNQLDQRIPVDHVPSRVTWVNPCFLEYRVPVYRELDLQLNNGLTIICSKQRMKESICEQMAEILGQRFIALPGEKILRVSWRKGDFANTGFQVPFQPRLIKTILDSSPDVIISEGFFQWGLSAFRAAARRHVPVVITYERTAHTERNAGFLRTVYRRICASVAEVVCCNGSLSSDYCHRVLKVPNERIATGVMAADTESLKEKVLLIDDKEITAFKEKLSLKPPVFLFIGRLIRLKGVSELLRSWEIYKENSNQPNGSLLIVGDGPERGRIEDNIKTRKLNDVHLLGSVTYSEIGFYYSIADVLVMPSLEDNWSLVVPEAMSCGKPVLCSIFNGCWPELVKSGLNGWTFNPLRPEQLVALFEWCAVHLGELVSMGEASSRINEDFSPQKAAEALFRACKKAAFQFKNKNHS